MKTIKQMMMNGKEFSFSYSPKQAEFDESAAGAVLTGKIANIVNIGPSLLRKAAGDRYIAESYSEVSVRVIGETITNRWVDKILEKDGVLVNEGEYVSHRMLIVDLIKES